MYLIAVFTSAGAPQTGLTPTVDVYQLSDSSQVVTAANMTHVFGGIYVYDFTSYDAGEDYVWRADGGVSLDNTDRYIYGSDSVKSPVHVANMRIASNQLILSNDNGDIATYNLFDQADDPANEDVYKRELA